VQAKSILQKLFPSSGIKPFTEATLIEQPIGRHVWPLSNEPTHAGFIENVAST
jgi:hypothetical protein